MWWQTSTPLGRGRLQVRGAGRLHLLSNAKWPHVRPNLLNVGKTGIFGPDLLLRAIPAGTPGPQAKLNTAPHDSKPLCKSFDPDLTRSLVPHMN